MTPIRMIIILTCLLISTVGFTKDEEIYKWVDAKNQVHYGSNPPLGVNATLITTNTGPSDNAVNEAEEINKSIDGATTSKEPGTTPTTNPADDSEKQKQAACEQAKVDFTNYTHTLMTSGAGEHGNDIDKREALIQEKQASVDAACAP